MFSQPTTSTAECCPVGQADFRKGAGRVAYPADYGNSGVMALIVNHAGKVYRRDLCENAEARIESMTSIDPDKTQKKVDTTNNA